MLNTSKQEIIDKIYNDWGEKPQFNICMSILDYLVKKSSQEYLHLTYSLIKKIVSSKYNDEDILLAIQYLCGYRTNILNTQFELIEDNDNIVDISKEKIKEAQETGQLFHPYTGEPIQDFEDKVFLYFVPSSLIRNITI